MDDYKETYLLIDGDNTFMKKAISKSSFISEVLRRSNECLEVA